MNQQERQNAIASLPGHLGFRLLVSDIEESFTDILASLAGAKTDEQLIHYARMFQVFYRMRSLLTTEPQKMREEVTNDLDAIHMLLPTDAGAPAFPAYRAEQLMRIETEVNQ